MNWHFNVIDDTVLLRARLEDDGERIGDAHAIVARGEDFYGVSYAALRGAEAGVVAVSEDGVGRLVPDDESDDETKDFDPNQPRDDHGRWTSGGGTSAAPKEPLKEHGNAEGVPPVVSQESLRIQNDKWHDRQETNYAFPNISLSNSTVVGFGTSRYNCAGYAFGDTKRWWWPSSPEYGEYEYWPEGFSRNHSVQNFDELFEAVNATEVPEKFWNDVHPGWVSIALYVDDDNVPMHLARLADDGRWISKTGAEELIEHEHLEDIGGGLYGHVAKVYSMKTEDWRKLKAM